jgi:hypothetical protein
MAIKTASLLVLPWEKQLTILKPLPLLLAWKKNYKIENDLACKESPDAGVQQLEKQEDPAKIPGGKKRVQPKKSLEDNS